MSDPYRLTLGRKYYDYVNTKYGVVNNKNVLLYFFDNFEITKTKTKIKNENEINTLTQQNIIKFKNSFYRKSNTPNVIYNICEIDNVILLDETDDCTKIIIDNSNYQFIEYISFPLTKINIDNILYHGTPYQMPSDSNHAPYNWYGNWFSPSLDESSTYMCGINGEERRLYIYRTTQSFNILNINNEGSLLYVLICIAFLKTIIDNTNHAICIYTNKTIGVQRNQIVDLEKYDYTIRKNLLRPDLQDDFGLFNVQNDKLEDGFVLPIKMASSGDGDKPLAAEICSINNENLPNNKMKINGWSISDVNHIMICNPKSVLENIAGSSDGKTFRYDTKSADYNAYFKKYLKYKTKYNQLKNKLKN